MNLIFSRPVYNNRKQTCAITGLRTVRPNDRAIIDENSNAFKFAYVSRSACLQAGGYEYCGIMCISDLDRLERVVKGEIQDWTFFYESN